MRLYLHVLRGTQLARRQKVITLRYASYAVAGTIEGLDWDLDSANELLCPFSFSFRVKLLLFVNTTPVLVPTRPNGPVADPDSIAYDGGRPRTLGSVVRMFGSTPPDTVPGPTGAVPESASVPSDSSLQPADGSVTPSPNFSPNVNPNVRETRPAPAVYQGTAVEIPPGTPGSLYAGPPT